MTMTGIGTYLSGSSKDKSIRLARLKIACTEA
jgi:hypothetical protein